MFTRIQFIVILALCIIEKLNLFHPFYSVFQNIVISACNENNVIIYGTNSFVCNFKTINERAIRNVQEIIFHNEQVCFYDLLSLPAK